MEGGGLGGGDAPDFSDAPCKMLKVAERWVTAEPGNTEAQRTLRLARGRTAAYRGA